jgi:hypothetical protein
MELFGFSFKDGRWSRVDRAEIAAKDTVCPQAGCLGREGRVRKQNGDDDRRGASQITDETTS